MNRKASARAIPQTARRVLDAPDVNNDYYLNLLDWSVTNYLCVALNTSVFLWNAGSGDIMELTEVLPTGDYISLGISYFYLISRSQICPAITCNIPRPLYLEFTILRSFF